MRVEFGGIRHDPGRHKHQTLEKSIHHLVRVFHITIKDNVEKDNGIVLMTPTKEPRMLT